MKVYEVKQQMSSLRWRTLGFLLKKKDAEKYQLLYNTKVVIYPTKIIEHKLLEIKDFEDELEG
jgi:UDP-galactopyranose mutase